MSQGSRANYTGDMLEDVIEHVLIRKGYELVPKSKFQASTYLEQPTFSKQFPIAKSIYGTDLFCDFVLFHPDKYPECLIIESKWQQSSGSVDEKFPYLVANIREQYPAATIVVLDGGGYKFGAEQWLRRQVDDKLIHVFNMMEFQRWSNSDEL